MQLIKQNCKKFRKVNEVRKNQLKISKSFENKIVVIDIEKWKNNVKEGIKNFIMDKLEIDV